MNINLLRSRAKLELAASKNQYNRLKSVMTDIAIVKYLTTSLQNASGGRFQPSDEDIIASKYVMSILSSLGLRDEYKIFKELMYYRAVNDMNSYKTVLAEYEKDFANCKNEDDR
jgi:hypothetical protein